MNKLTSWYAASSKGFRFFLEIICWPLWGPLLLLVLIAIWVLLAVPVTLYEEWKKFV